MIKVYLSKMHTNFFFIQYSGVITTEEDVIINPDILIPYFKKTKNIHLVMEYLPTTVITDKDFFNTSGLQNFDVNRELNAMVSIGLMGIQKAFIRDYYNNTTYKEIKFYNLENISEFNLAFNLSFKESFDEVFTFESK